MTRPIVAAFLIALGSMFASATYGGPIPFTNYAALCQEDLQWTDEGVAYGSHWSWRFTEGPFTWLSDDDAPLPNWSMSAFAREEDIWAGGSSLVITAHEPGDPSAVTGTLTLRIEAVDHAPNYNADDAIVDEDAGLIMTSFGYRNLPGSPSTIITETLDKTGVFENIELVGDQNIYFNGYLFLRRIEGMDVQENIYQTLGTEGPLGGFCTAVWDGAYEMVPEPSAIASLLSAAAVGLLACRLRRRRSRTVG